MMELRRQTRTWGQRTFLLVASLAASTAFPLQGQVSLTTAVELALRNSPRVKVAEAEVDKARAALSQSRDVYVPALAAGAGLGQSYGYSPNPPTLFTFTAQSLVYNASQTTYIRSARSGLGAATLTLQDVREAVAEDAAVTFVALDHDQQREEVLRKQGEYAARLVTIVQERFDAGRETQIDLTTARLSAAQLHLRLLRAQDDTANDRTHLARLMDLPPTSLRAEGGFPASPLAGENFTPAREAVSPAVASAFANATAKQQLAFGDARYLYRPQVSLVIQYSRYATFTDSFKKLQAANRDPADPTKSLIGANETAFGVQVNLPLFDKFRQAKNRESAAEASRALHEAESASASALDGQSKLSHTIGELRARAEVASLEQQLAQQQLEVIILQLKDPANGGGRSPITPKDEQNARISEREKYLAVIDTTFQLHETEINLMRQTGRLEDWLKNASRAALPAVTP